MVIGKQNISKPGRRKEQSSSSSTELNGNHTGGTEHGLSLIPPNTGVGQENGR
jgi:hypothetical protein